MKALEKVRLYSGRKNFNNRNRSGGNNQSQASVRNTYRSPYQWSQSSTGYINTQYANGSNRHQGAQQSPNNNIGQQRNHRDKGGRNNNKPEKFNPSLDYTGINLDQNPGQDIEYKDKNGNQHTENYNNGYDYQQRLNDLKAQRKADNKVNLSGVGDVIGSIFGKAKNFVADKTAAPRDKIKSSYNNIKDEVIARTPVSISQNLSQDKRNRIKQAQKNVLRNNMLRQDQIKKDEEYRRNAKEEDLASSSIFKNINNDTRKPTFGQRLRHMITGRYSITYNKYTKTFSVDESKALKEKSGGNLIQLSGEAKKNFPDGIYKGNYDDFRFVTEDGKSLSFGSSSYGDTEFEAAVEVKNGVASLRKLEKDEKD